MQNKSIFTEIHIANNLGFRIEASNVLANYKLTQNFTLGELIKTATHEFSTTAKEIVLAKYDAWFLFLMDMEHVIAMSTDLENFKKIIKYIENKYDKYIRDDEFEILKHIIRRDIVIEYDIKEVIKILTLIRYRIYSKIIENESLFDKQYVEFWGEIHDSLFQSLMHKITATKFEPASYYNGIGIYLSRLLHHTLYEVYEIDILFNKELPFLVLNYDDVVNDVMSDLKINALEYRLKKYIEECSKRGYKKSTVKLKLYEEQLNDKIILDVEQLAADNGLEMIKE